MARQIKLECFELQPEIPEPRAIGDSELEDIKLTAFEKGYTAGWDDAIAAQNDETKRLHEGLGKNLLALSTDHDAIKGAMLEALWPLIFSVISKVLPLTARESLGHIILEHLRQISDETLNIPVKIRAHPAALPQVQAILSEYLTIPATFEAFGDLSEYAVTLEFADVEKHIDLSAVLQKIEHAIQNFYAEGQQNGQ